MNAHNSPSWGEPLYDDDTGVENLSRGNERTESPGDACSSSWGERIGDMSSFRVHGSAVGFERRQSYNDCDDDNTCSYDDDDGGVECNSIGTWNSEKNNGNDGNGIHNSDNSHQEEEKKKDHEPVDDSDSDSDVVQVWPDPAVPSKRPPPPMASTATQPPSFAAPTLGSIASSLNSAAASYHSRTPSMPSWMSSGTQHAPWPPPRPRPFYLELPPHHVSTWTQILPPDFFAALLRTPTNPPRHPAAARRTLTLSLLNVWEFTIEPSTPGDDALAGLRTHIKKIAKNHIGHDGRRGALFDRLQWRIPLGAYQALLTFLTRDPGTTVRAIPPEQLRAATLGREQFQKNAPSASDLMRRGVHPRAAKALAPYQRKGVDFILEKEGRALLADEMGLGKTLQAVAAMSAFGGEWPLLVLCPSSARYHWEVEVRHWLGGAETTESDGEDRSSKGAAWELKKEAINVLTSGKSPIFRSDGATKVVVCSYGLIVSLVQSGRIFEGMFNAVIVDESHALKNKASKRTLAILPLLKAADRCLLLSGTPALARPSELWPQLSVLGGRRKDGREEDGASGIWMDEEGFYSKYVRGELGEENGSKARLAELHTLLTSTVMIRRMKADILKNLQPKIREKAFIDIHDPAMQNEFRTYMQMLRQGGGVMGKFAREHATRHSAAGNGLPQIHDDADGERIGSREALHHLYKITGRSKVSKVTHMLKRWLADPTLGKLCIFAHHLDVLDAIGRGAGLSNHKDSTTKYIRIDGATLPKARQEQILLFQTDPSVRIALLGITAAGVAVTLTASSTVWFAELFWTPAIMIQAEDRCHRIGQQARVRCLYFIARGTLDEILWKLIEKKFRDLGEFVEGRENMDIALERELEEEDDAEILKVDSGADSKKRKAQEDVSDFFDLEDDGIKEEINELVHEEEDMLAMKNEEEDDDPDSEERGTKQGHITLKKDPIQQSAAGSSETSAICILDDDEKEDKILTIPEIRNLYTSAQIWNIVPFDHSVRLNHVSIYQLQFRGERYGFNMFHFKGRAIVRESFDTGTKVGAIIVAIGRWVLQQEPFEQIQMRLKNEIRNHSPATLTFADDPDFISLFLEDYVPRMQRIKAAQPVSLPPPRPTSETIDLLDDDDDDG